MVISIDDGSNFTKLAFEKDNQTITTSFASRVIRSALPSVDGSGFSSGSYQIDSQNFAVAESAADTIPTNNRSYQTSYANRVLINHALKQTGATEADIVLTLPVSQFFKADGSKNENLIKEKTENAKGEIFGLDGAPLCKINDCFVLPEGVPAFAHAQHELELENGLYLMADIGGTTTDLVVFDENNQIQNFKSVNVGAIAMIASFTQSVVNQLQINELPERLALRGLLTGDVAGVDVSDHVRTVLSAFESKVMDQVSTMGDLALFDGVIFSGGGAELMGADFTNVLKTTNPQFDNTLGSLAIVGG